MESNSDFFAYLPDCILLLIVSFLPFKEAARTSVLSKRWKHIWKDSTIIDLNENFFRNIVDQAMAPLNQVFLDFARGFVFHHLGATVHNFQFLMSESKEYIADVKCLHKFAASKKVEVLDLNFWSFNENKFLELPLCVYEHEAMHVLKLTQCDLMQVEVTKFSALKSLHLLTSLTIVECIPIDKEVQICAPKLEDFKYYGAFEAFKSDDVVSIKNIDLDFGFEHIGHLPSSLCPAGLHAASGQIPALPAAATPPSPEPAVTSSLLAAAAISSLPCTQPSQTSPCTSLHPKLAGLVLPCLSPPAPLPVATHLHSASRHPPALSQRPPLLLPLSLVSVC
ncbi:hypothetical protein AAC387_Pa12g0566 [Persea americana]